MQKVIILFKASSTGDSYWSENLRLSNGETATIDEENAQRLMKAFPKNFSIPKRMPQVQPKKLETQKYIKSRDLPLKDYVDRLKHDKYFSFVRYGDGEWKAILGKGNKAGRAQRNTEEFRRDSKLTFLESCGSPEVYFGMQNYVLRQKNFQITIPKFLRKNSIGIRWVNADVFHYASRDGKLAPLIGEMRRKNVVVIGPGFLRGLQKHAFKYRKFIEVAARNCHSQKREVMNAVLAAQKELGPGILYSFSVGPSAEVFIPPLFNKAPQNFFIDFGSLWDVFCGRRSRGYTMNKEKYTDDILKRNLAG